MSLVCLASPEATARQLRAAAATSGLNCTAVSWVDACASLVGAHLWSAFTGRTDFSAASRWVGVAYPVGVWGANIMVRSTGSPTVGAFPNWDGMVCEPPLLASSRILEAVGRAETFLCTVPELSSDQMLDVWSRVASDACVDSPQVLWIRDVIAATEPRIHPQFRL